MALLILTYPITCFRVGCVCLEKIDKKVNLGENLTHLTEAIYFGQYKYMFIWCKMMNVVNYMRL